MNEGEEVQCETIQRQAPKTGKKNFGQLARGGKQGGANPQTRLGRMQNRQYFDSAEYSLHKDAVKKDENAQQQQSQQHESKEQQN